MQKPRHAASPMAALVVGEIVELLRRRPRAPIVGCLALHGRAHGHTRFPSLVVPKSLDHWVLRNSWISGRRGGERRETAFQGSICELCRGYPVVLRLSGCGNVASSHQAVRRLRFSRRSRRLDQGEAERKKASKAEARAYPHDADGAEAWRGAHRRRLVVLGRSRADCLPRTHPRYSAVHR